MLSNLAIAEETESGELVMEQRYSTLEYALFRLDIATSTMSIQSWAHTLYCVLKQHFALEDNSAAFFSSIQDLASNSQVRIWALRKEHPILLKRVNQLALGEIQAKTNSALRLYARELIGAIRQHEAVETQTYFEGLYNELGGQG